MVVQLATLIIRNFGHVPVLWCVALKYMGNRTAERCVNNFTKVLGMCGHLGVLKVPLATTLTGRAAGSHAMDSMHTVS